MRSEQALKRFTDCYARHILSPRRRLPPPAALQFKVRKAGRDRCRIEITLIFNVPESD
jgi:hypothetical protein